MSIEKLLKPQSIAVVGATDRIGSFGYSAAYNSINSIGIDGRVYYVNPKRTMVQGRRTFKSLAEIPEVVDCVMICTPRDIVMPIFKEAAAIGIKAAVVFASGYTEKHTAKGIELENQMKEIAKENDMCVLGPNCAGLINNVDKVNLWGLETRFDINTRSTGIGIVAHSGFIAQGIIESSYYNLSYGISTGNGNITTLEDFIEYMVDDDNTKVIGMYLEGLKDTKKFIRVLKKAAIKRKPIVVLKAGKSQKGAVSAASHTGNLAGSAKAFESVFKKFGVMTVNCLEDLMCLAQMFSVLGDNIPNDDGVGAINLSGGENTICADLSQEYGINLPDVSDETKSEMDKYLPDFATAKNPLDATTALFGDTGKTFGLINAFEQSDKIDSIIVGLNVREYEDPVVLAFCEALVESRQKGCKKPVFVIPPFEACRDIDMRNILESNQIALLSSSKSAYACIKQFNDFAVYDYKKMTLQAAVPDEKKDNKIPRAVSEYDAKIEISKLDLPIPKQAIVYKIEDVEQIVATLKFPLVMKINSPDILHKSDVGGVKLNIISIDEAKKYFDEILLSCKLNAPDAKIDGILIQEMAEKGTEIIVGISNDPQFGPMVLVGLGGIFVELYKDAVLYPVPINKHEAHTMLKQLKAYKLLNGYRGAKPCDIDALVDLIVKISDYAYKNKDTIKEIDLNPVFVYEKGRGVCVVDSLIVKNIDIE